ncbi:MAG TPA: Crp/Fnr family transcriptional regulator [Candidatus Nitrosotenuis sp.]|nr:Crp/Fnr family transcriptional regulator [Candidatus Nitrosotenuis sp.]
MLEDIAPLLYAHGTRRVIKKRVIILYQGEVPRQAYVVLSGAIKMYRLSDAGEEEIIGFRTAGDIFPETWLYGKTTSTLYYYETMDDCEVLTTERSTMLDLIDKNPILQRQMLNYFIDNYTGLLMQVTALSQSRAGDKLLLILFYLMFRYGKENTPGIYTLELHLTHAMVGSLIGMTRETATVELGKLRRKNIVNYDAKSFTIHRKELEKRLGDDSFSDITLVS